MQKASEKISLVLFSGGMDSTVALYQRLAVARQEGGQVHALTFSYGQRHKHEVNYAKLIWSALSKNEYYRDVLGEHVVTKLQFPMFGGSLLGGAPVTKYDDVMAAKNNGDFDTSFIPFRNLVMLSMAAVWAYKLGAGVITTGLRGGFPDCTEAFEDAMQAAMRIACPDHPITIQTPTHMSRAATIALAQSLPGCYAALALTLTCFEGTRPPCGHCLPCLKRAEGFALAGIADPLMLSATTPDNVLMAGHNVDLMHP